MAPLLSCYYQWVRHRLWFLIAASDSFLLSLLAAWSTEAFLHARIAIWGSFAGLQKAHNDGIAFGIGLGPFQGFFIVAALLLVATAGWRTAHSKIEQIGYGLIVGGGAANLVDRLIDGQVTDMLQIGTFPIFNVADVCINVGVAMLLVTLLGKRMEN